jgi:hypothetical protein
MSFIWKYKRRFHGDTHPRMMEQEGEGGDGKERKKIEET